MRDRANMEVLCGRLSRMWQALREKTTMLFLREAKAEMFGARLRRPPSGPRAVRQALSAMAQARRSAGLSSCGQAGGLCSEARRVCDGSDWSRTVPAGAPASNRTRTRAVTDALRACASHQRHQDRQPTGEPATPLESRTSEVARLHSNEATRARHLDLLSLRQVIRTEGQSGGQPVLLERMSITRHVGSSTHESRRSAA